MDGLKTSEYLNETAAKHIEGDITIEQVKELIDTYYKSKTARTPEDDEKEEADKAAANITKIMDSPLLHNRNSAKSPLKNEISQSFIFNAMRYNPVNQHYIIL